MHDELHRLINAFARLGGNESGGVRRLTGTDEDAAARRLFVEEAIKRGARVHVDEIGNLFATFALSPASDSTVLVGSHLDSQPTGGKYDGAYGVIAGLVAAHGIASAAERGKPPRHNLTVVNWTNEEGARFQPSLTGSAVFVGALPLQKALALEDPDGVPLGDALEAIGFLGTSPFPLSPVRYVELHVEQGDRLESAGCEIGLVHGAWATRKLTLTFVGEASHTGPTPMARRRDALRAAAFAITRFHETLETRPENFHFSAARIRIVPDSPNVVPSRATVWFEIRHPDLAATVEAGDLFLRDIVTRLAAGGISVEVEGDEKRPDTPLDPPGLEMVRAAALSTGKSVLDVETIAGHDALSLQKIVPSSLIFVPSADGLSHNEKEHTEQADLENGLEVLVATLHEMVARD